MLRRARAPIALAALVIASVATAQEAGPTIPPGQEALVLEMVRAEGSGCALDGVSVSQHEIRARYTCSGAGAEVVLRHPDSAGDAIERTSRFAITAGDPPPSPGLIVAVAAGARAGEDRFDWIMPAPSRTASPDPEPPAPAPDAPVLALAANGLARSAALFACALVAAWLARARRGPRLVAGSIALALAIGLALRAAGEAIAAAGLGASGAALALVVVVALAVACVSAIAWAARRRRDRSPYDAWTAAVIVLVLGVCSIGAEIGFAREHRELSRFGTLSTGQMPGTIVDGDPRRVRVDDRWSRRGFRGPDFTDRPAPGTTRIVIVGDSFVAGMGVRWPDTIGERLHAELDDSLQAGALEVLNLGIPGDNLRSHVDAVRAAADLLEPALVVLCLTLPNDLSERDTQDEIDAPTHLGTHAVMRALLGGRFVAWLAADDLARSFDAQAREVLDRELARLVEERETRPSPPLLVFAYGEHDAEVRGRLDGAPGIRVATSVPVLPGYTIPGDGHPTAIANAAYARHLARTILADPLLSGAITIPGRER